MGSHHKWRAQAKKMRRKRIRQKLAQERDNLILKEHEEREKSPHFQAWFSEQKALELFAKEEEARQSAERHAAWVAEEARAQKAWRERQERLAMARAERAKQELRIKEEWEEEQLKLKAAKEEKERIAQEKHQKQEDLMRQIENFINKGCDMPMEVNVASETNPDRQPCPFFTKTGACRFGDRCSRNHMRPAISRVLIVPNFYDHIGLRQMNPDELEAADDWLEYEDAETYHNFLMFYEDVLPEWERVGKISQFKVCCNFEPHLRGNVYVEYESAQHAVQAFKKFHGRFYGGKQINVEFANIDSWKSAICGQFHKQCCPKGRACNFLHVFRNPGNAFHAADRDRQEWRLRLQRTERSTPTSPRRCRDRSWSNSPENSSRRKDWRWSVSPSPPPEVNISSWHRSSRDQSQHNYKEDFSPRRRRSSRRGRSRSKDKSGRSSHISDRFRTRKGHSSRHDSKVHSSKRDSQNKSRDSDDHNFRRKTKDKDIPENQRLIEVCAKVPLGDQEASNCVNGKSSSESKRNSVCDTSLNFSSSVIDIATNFTSISQNDSSLSNAENIDGVDSHNNPSEKVTLKERKSRKKKKVYRKKKRKRKVSVKSDSSSSSDTSDEVK